MNTDAAKILTLDIETSPAVAYVWKTFDENISNAQIIDSSRILTFGYKWNFQSKVQVETEWGAGGHVSMVETMWAMLDEADVIVTYNGKRFDVPHMNREFLLAGLTPPSPYQHIDLYQTIRSKFKFISGKLEWVVRQLELGEKMKHEGFDLWKNVLAGDEAARKRMVKYNAMDVEITDSLYQEVKPWISTHPNIALISGVVHACPTCCSVNVQKRGVSRTSTAIYQRYQCNDCGAYSKSGKSLATTALRPVSV